MGGSSRVCRTSGRTAGYAVETAKEAEFDHLRDWLATDPREQVRRPFRVALVDEADSLLVDEARVPLVIAGLVETSSAAADGPRSRARSRRACNSIPTSTAVTSS
jgi:preprotein translocase subunit SecA